MIKQQHKRLLGIVLLISTLLLIPLVAMIFTDEVIWTLSDFIIAGILLLGARLTLEFILRKIKKTKLKIVPCFALILMFILVWGELAVGIFGTSFTGS